MPDKHPSQMSPIRPIIIVEKAPTIKVTNSHLYSSPMVESVILLRIGGQQTAKVPPNPGWRSCVEGEQLGRG